MSGPPGINNPIPPSRTPTEGPDEQPRGLEGRRPAFDVDPRPPEGPDRRPANFDFGPKPLEGPERRPTDFDPGPTPPQNDRLPPVAEGPATPRGLEGQPPPGLGPEIPRGDPGFADAAPGPRSVPQGPAGGAAGGPEARRPQRREAVGDDWDSSLLDPGRRSQGTAPAAEAEGLLPLSFTEAVEEPPAAAATPRTRPFQAHPTGAGGPTRPPGEEERPAPHPLARRVASPTGDADAPGRRPATPEVAPPGEGTGLGNRAPEADAGRSTPLVRKESQQRSARPPDAEAPRPGSPPVEDASPPPLQPAVGHNVSLERQRDIGQWAASNIDGGLWQSDGNRLAQALANRSSLGAMNAGERQFLMHQALDRWVDQAHVGAPLQNTDWGAIRDIVAVAPQVPGLGQVAGQAMAQRVAMLNELPQTPHQDNLRQLAATLAEGAVQMSPPPGDPRQLVEQLGPHAGGLAQSLAQRPAALLDTLQALNTHPPSMASQAFVAAALDHTPPEAYRQIPELAEAMGQAIGRHSHPDDPRSQRQTAERLAGILATPQGQDLLASPTVPLAQRHQALELVLQNPQWDATALTRFEGSGWQHPGLMTALARPTAEQFAAAAEAGPMALEDGALRHLVAAPRSPTETPADGAKRELALKNALGELGGDAPKVTVLPIQFASDTTGAVTSALLRVEGHDGQPRFVDLNGQRFESFDAWRRGNDLPPGNVTFPAEGQFQRDSRERLLLASENTPNTAKTPESPPRGTDNGAGGQLPAGTRGAKGEGPRPAEQTEAPRGRMATVEGPTDGEALKLAEKAEVTVGRLVAAEVRPIAPNDLPGVLSALKAPSTTPTTPTPSTSTTPQPSPVEPQALPSPQTAAATPQPREPATADNGADHRAFQELLQRQQALDRLHRERLGAELERATLERLLRATDAATLQQLMDKGLEPRELVALQQFFDRMPSQAGPLLAELAQKPQGEVQAAAKAVEIEGANGGHSLLRHGPQVQQEWLERQVKEAIAPDGSVSYAEFATRFNGYPTWIETRQEALENLQELHGIHFGPRLDIPPMYGQPMSYRIVLDHGKPIDEGVVCWPDSRGQLLVNPPDGQGGNGGNGGNGKDGPGSGETPGEAEGQSMVSNVCVQTSPLEGNRRTLTTVHWDSDANEGRGQWVVSQHMPYPQGWDQGNRRYSDAVTGVAAL
ncbi:MAG: hypothetical protein ACFCBW_01335 [Candidatus Competibacterales bacterium]